MSQAGNSNLFSMYMELGKARLSALVLTTTSCGYVLASPTGLDWLRFGWTLIGTAALALGVNAFNQWMEVSRDRLMQRTCNRPLPSGRLSRIHAFLWATAMSLGGALILWFGVNPITTALGLFVLVLYLLCYTPMKTRSSLNTLVGAICGAVPPMMGWTGASGQLQAGAWILAAILFVWQIPHFLALAWLYRTDYARGGFRMLPLFDPNGRLTFSMVVVYSLAIVPVALSITLAGLTGWIYAWGSFVLGLGMVFMGIELYREGSDRNARRMFLASVIYLPLLLGLMVVDRTHAPNTNFQTEIIEVQVEYGQTTDEPLKTASTDQVGTIQKAELVFSR